MFEKICTFHFYINNNNVYNKLKYFVIEAYNFLDQKVKSSILIFSKEQIYLAFPSVFSLHHFNKSLTKKIPCVEFIPLKELPDKIREISKHKKPVRIGIDSESETLKNENIFQITDFKNFLRKNFCLENIKFFLHEFNDKFAQKSLIWNLIATNSIFFLLKKEFAPKYLFLFQPIKFKNQNSLLRVDKNFKKLFNFDLKKVLIFLKIKRNFTQKKFSSNSSFEIKQQVFSPAITFKFYEKNNIFFYQKFSILNPTLKIMILYQIYLNATRIFFEKFLNKRKNLKLENIFCHFFHILSENTRYKIFKILNIGKKRLYTSKIVIFGKIFNRKKFFLNISEKKCKKFDISIFENFFLSPRGSLIDINFNYSQELKKIAFFCKKTKEINPKKRLIKSKKLLEITKIFFRLKKDYLNRKKINFLPTEIQKVPFLNKSKKNYQILSWEKFKKFKKFFFRWSLVHCYFFQKNFMLINYWNIKKISMYQHNYDFFFKIKFYKRRSKKKKEKSNEIFVLFFFSNRKNDLKKIRLKFKNFYLKLKNKNLNEKPIPNFKLKFLEKNVVEIRNIYFKKHDFKDKKEFGRVQLHENGLKFLPLEKKETMLISYQDIKYILYENNNNDIIIHITIFEEENTGKFKINFYFQVIFEEFNRKINLKNTKKNMASDSEYEEKSEIEKMQKNKNNFNRFINILSLLSGKNTDFLIPNFGFWGIFEKKNIFFNTHKNCIACLSNTDPVIIPLFLIQNFCFERMNGVSKNFDLVFIFNNFISKWGKIKHTHLTISSLSHHYIKKIQTLARHFLIENFSSYNNLDWNFKVEKAKFENRDKVEKNNDYEKNEIISNYKTKCKSKKKKNSDVKKKKKIQDFNFQKNLNWENLG
jgi:hypothetical protein